MNFGDFVTYESRRGIYIARQAGSGGRMLVFDLRYLTVFAAVREWELA